MKIGYYPGCTLKTKARNLEDSALAALQSLGVEVQEMERWNCCGAVYSLSDDDLIHMIAPVRDLIRAQEQGFDKIITLCSQCYNTLARANILMREDEEKRDTINTFMEEEEDYRGEVEVYHLLNFLRDEIGFDRLREQIKVPLNDLKVAPFYGCTLLRPREVGIDPQIDRPQLLKDFLAALGATVIDFPESIECCGSYTTLVDPSNLTRTRTILQSAQQHGAQSLVLSCPLCDYNLGRRQSKLSEEEGFAELPVFYFSQLLSIALGVSPESHRLELNNTDTTVVGSFLQGAS